MPDILPEAVRKVVVTLTRFVYRRKSQFCFNCDKSDIKALLPDPSEVGLCIDCFLRARRAH